MIIERTNKKIIFKLPADLDIEKLQEVFDFLRFKELTKDSVASQAEANELANESKRTWWAANSHKFFK